MEKFDVVVVGAGIAGLTAALNIARANKSVGVIEKNVPGGQILSTPDVQNFPGFESVSGFELTDRVKKQAEAFGAKIIYDNIVSLALDGELKTMKGVASEYGARVVILAMGTQNKTLGLKNESELVGSGVSYCATCDGAFFKDKVVMVAGDGKTAASDVEYLAPIAKTVYALSSKLPEFKQKNVKKTGGIIAELIGSPLNSVRINEGGKETVLRLDGLFIAAGYSPSTFIVKGIVELSDKGYIITDENMRTSLKCVYAAGDVRKKEFRQLITAASDGAVAAHFALKDIR